ncbi:MAG: transglutaminase domain-containing protein [Nitrosopumilus sp.]
MKRKISKRGDITISITIILLASFVVYQYFPVGLDNIIDTVVEEGIRYNMDDKMLDEIITNCDYGNPRMSLKCLNDLFNKNYRYSPQPKTNSINYTLNEFADCDNAVSFYCSALRNMGYNCRGVTMNTVDSRHAVAILSWEDEYCLIDQTTFICYQLG